MEEKITMRELTGQEFFPMLKILHKVKAKQVVTEFLKLKETTSKKISDEVNQAVKSVTGESMPVGVTFGEFMEMVNDEERQKLKDVKKKLDEESEAIGIDFFASLADIVMANAEYAKDDINKLLSSLTGLSETQITKLDMVDYGTLLLEFFAKPEFGDFFKRIVSSNVFQNLK